MIRVLSERRVANRQTGSWLVRVARTIGRAWIAFCVVAMVTLACARALHFAAAPLPSPFEGFVGGILRLEFVTSMNAFFDAPLLVAACFISALVLLVHRRWGIARVGAAVRLRTWLAGVLWGTLLALNFLLDANVDLARLYAATFPCLWLAFAVHGMGRRSALLPAALWGVVFVAWLLLAPTAVARVFGIPWIALAAGLSHFGPGRLLLLDITGMQLAFGVALQVGILLPGAIPSVLLPHGGSLLGTGRVYSYCEIPNRDTVLGTITSCEGSDVEKCRGDHLVAYRLSGRHEGRVIPVFDDHFYGRMLHLLCLEDTIRVGMSFTMIDGKQFRENVLSFDPNRPELRTPRRLPVMTGHRMLYDPIGAAVFYVSEYSNHVVVESLKAQGPSLYRFRVDGGEREPVDEAILPGGGSLQTEISALSARRKSLFFAEWIAGDRIFEVDRETLRTRSTLVVNSGGTHSLTIDDEFGRVIATGLWGIEVIDLQTGRVVSRWRTHLGPRLPVIDAKHGLVYITATFGPDIWVFDRKSMRPLGRVPVGVGARNALLSSDGRAYFAGNAQAHFVWDADTLAKRFGR